MDQLPSEMVMEIFKRSSLRSVFRIRQTCRYLNTVFLTNVRRLCDRDFSPPCANLRLQASSNNIDLECFWRDHDQLEKSFCYTVWKRKVTTVVALKQSKFDFRSVLKQAGRVKMSDNLLTDIEEIVMGIAQILCVTRLVLSGEITDQLIHVLSSALKWEKLDSVVFKSAQIRLTDANGFKSFLVGTKAKSIECDNCSIKTFPIFWERNLFDEMKFPLSVIVKSETTFTAPMKETFMEFCFGVKCIGQIEINLECHKDLVIKKFENWLAGLEEIEKLALQICNDQWEFFFEYFNAKFENIQILESQSQSSKSGLISKMCWFIRNKDGVSRSCQLVRFYNKVGAMETFFKISDCQVEVEIDRCCHSLSSLNVGS